MRQPKIYITLPSNGEYWPEGSLVKTETNEYPVYSMTARDELILQIPDALMNGQGVVDMIQSCVPNIKNAWDAPSIDIDLILIAIRLATFGDKYTVPLNFSDDLDMEYQVSLTDIIQTLASSIKWNPIIPINDQLTIYVKPLSYRDITKMTIAGMETQKIMDIVADESLNEEDKVNLFKESLGKLTAITLGTVQASIYKVDTPNGSTTDKNHIDEFVNNIDKEIFNQVQQHLEMLKDINALKPIKIPVSDEMREKGYEGEFVEVPIQFDPSNFFA